MKKTNLPIFIVLTVLTLTACRGKEQTSKEEYIEFNQNAIEAFGKQLEQTVLDGNADFFNNSYDKEYIKEQIRNNSIVNSALDADFGTEFFENCFYTGTEVVRMVDAGGDFKYVGYRFDEKDGTHHIILRSYIDFTINFYDFIIDSCNNKLVIKDGFIYNTGQKFSDNVRENVLLNTLYRTNPEGIPQILTEVKACMEKNRNKEAWQLLKNHQNELKYLSVYRQLFIANMYKVLPKTAFVDSLNALEQQGVDKRLIATHLLTYFVNEGMTKEAEETIDAMIGWTNDDPIYLLLFGKANIFAKNYETALYCFQNCEQFLSPIWDLWYSKLECYNALNDKENYTTCLLSGKKNYNMSDTELQEMTKKYFPKMQK